MVKVRYFKIESWNQMGLRLGFVVITGDFGAGWMQVLRDSWVI